MKYTKKVSIKVDFAVKGVEIKDGDIIQLLDEGRTEPGTFGPQHVFKVKLAGGTEKDFSVNQTSLNNLIDAFGDEASEWIDKDVRVWAILQSVSGKMKKVYYLSHKDAEIDEATGEFVMTVKADDGIPVVNDDPGQTESDLPPEPEEDENE